MFTKACSILLILPTIIDAYLTVQVYVKPSINDNHTVEVYANVDEAISNEEKETFQITDQAVMEALDSSLGKELGFQKMENGTRLYKIYSWKNVKRNLVARNITVVSSSTTVDHTIASKYYYNYNKFEYALYRPKFKKQVRDVMRSKWHGTDELSYERPLLYYLNKIHLPANGRDVVEYMDSWGSERLKEKVWNIGLDCETVVAVSPREGIAVHLRASVGHIETQIHYDSYIDGEIEIEHVSDSTSSRKRIQKVNVTSIIEFNGLKNLVNWKEDIAVDYYFEPTIFVRDNATNIILSVFNVNLKE